MSDCSAQPTGVDTIGDQVGTHLNYGIHDAGYYGGGRNQHSPVHHFLMKVAADQVTRLDAQGQPDSSGKIGLIGLGFSYAVAVFNAVMGRIANLDYQPRSGLVPVNGALGGKDATKLANPADTVWTQHVPAQLAAAGVSALQVQVAYLITGVNNSGGAGYPTHVTNLLVKLKAIVAIARLVFPNLRLLYVDSVHAHHYMDPGVTPDVEPTFMQQGFAVRQLFLDQLAGDPALDPAIAPVIDWGGMLWCDGSRADSRGHAWLCPDHVKPDGHHTSDLGSDLLARLVVERWRGAVHARWLFGVPNAGAPGGAVPLTKTAG